MGKLRTIVKALKDQRFVRERRGQGLALTCDLASDAIAAVAAEYEKKTHRDGERLDRMVMFAQTALCRWKLLLDCLEEPPSWHGCGSCDNCLGTAHRAVGIAAGA